MWCQIRIVYTESIYNIVADTKAELSEMGINVTIQMIQHWDVAHIGFQKIFTGILILLLSPNLSKHNSPNCTNKKLSWLD